MYRKTLRPAIAMIELIFAIVVMGIVMMSAPMLVSTAAQSSYVTIQQEGINEAASRVNMIMSYAWDENDTNGSYVPPILNTLSATADLQEVILNVGGVPVRTGRRIGTPLESQRTYFISDAITSPLRASILGTDGAGETEDDIDDFGGTNLVVQDTDSNTINYVETATINIGTAVAYTEDNVTAGYSQNIITYVPFTASANSTNIKSITVTLTSTSGVADLNKNIVLRAFSCNVGGYEFKERVF